MSPTDKCKDVFAAAMRWMVAAVLAAGLALAGCASQPDPGTTSSTAAPSSPLPSTNSSSAAPLPAPLVGHCDLVVNSVGVTTGGVRDSFCPLTDAITAPLDGTHSLLVEVRWSALSPSVVALHSSIEDPKCPSSTALPPAPCPELAANDSVTSPVRMTLESPAYHQHFQNLSVFETARQGAAVQQSFQVTFTAFVQDQVPVGYQSK